MTHKALSRRAMISALGLGGAFLFGGRAAYAMGSACDAGMNGEQAHANLTGAFQLSDGEWQQRLNPMQYYVLRKGGTERPFSHPLARQHAVGQYHCAGCGQHLFDSSAKSAAANGWPYFTHPRPQATREMREMRGGRAVKALHCAGCNSHLGFRSSATGRGGGFNINGNALTFYSA